MEEPFLIRDFFSARIVEKIAHDIEMVYQDFDKKGFLNNILSKLESQSYSERKNSITDALINYLPEDYQTSIELLIKILPTPYEGEMSLDGEDRFYVGAFTAYVSRRGLDHYDLSMHALYEMTKSFTAEWDIRPFLLKYPEKTFAVLKKWVKDHNLHVRRLVSEGSRPNLPWGKKLKFVDEQPEETSLPLLEMLQNDNSEYVRRSVANHLNDLSKNNADLIVKHLGIWAKNNPGPNKDKLINHALRTLIKKGHKGALALIGYNDNFKLDVKLISITSKVAWGEKFGFKYLIKNEEKVNRKLLIDFIIGFQKKDGKISDKVFKLKKLELAPLEELEIKKAFSFKPITTRIYYPGKHRLSLQINGKIIARYTFELLKP